ncbi:MAG TPA: DinB family protein [Vicinamibacterales bacterium]|nr:DinB family protein [Vicinamibacterales bacterium]
MIVETFEQYTARLLALSAGADPVEVLASTPATIARSIHGRSAAALQRSPGPGRWSAAQIVAHLADAEIVFAYRLRMILAAPGTAIQAYDQDAWSRVQRAESSDAQQSLALFAAIRESTVRLVRGLGAEELDRYGIHAERGRESVRHLLALYAGHDRNHLAQIERLLT